MNQIDLYLNQRFDGNPKCFFNLLDVRIYLILRLNTYSLKNITVKYLININYYDLKGNLILYLYNKKFIIFLLFLLKL